MPRSCCAVDCPVCQGGSSDRNRPEKKAKFDGGYASTMQGAEAFFNKPSPFQKAAQEKEAAAAAAAAAGATEGSSVDASIADAVESAEIAAETTGTVIEVGRPARFLQNEQFRRLALVRVALFHSFRSLFYLLIEGTFLLMLPP